MRFAIHAHGIRESQIDDAITCTLAHVHVNVVAALTCDNATDSDENQKTASPPTNATNDPHGDHF